MRDHYAALGVSRDASLQEILHAYWRHVRLLGGEADGRRADLRDAYETLSDPARRARYDSSGDGALAAIRAATSPLQPFGPLTEPVPARPAPPSLNPLERLTAGLARGWRIGIDWIVTIAGAIIIVLLVKAFVVNPYRIPSSSMEPSLHCARPGAGCEARLSDRVLANRFIYHFHSPNRGEIIVFKTPTAAAEAACNASGTFVKRLIGLPGETVSQRSGFIFINGKKLNERYIQPSRRDTSPSKNGTWHVPARHYFFMGDNRRESCDSRRWGSVPRGSIIGEVFMTYWPPNRISFQMIGAGLALGLMLFAPLRRERRTHPKRGRRSSLDGS